MLATATSLPEMGTGISAIVLVDAPDLAAGDAFGSNLFNLMIIGLVADLYWRNGPVLTAVKFTSAVVAALGAGLIALAIAAIYIHHATSVASTWYLSPASVLLIVGFFAAMLLIYRHEKGTDASADIGEEPRASYADQSLRRAFGILLCFRGCCGGICCVAGDVRRAYCRRDGLGSELHGDAIPGLEYVPP